MQRAVGDPPAAFVPAIQRLVPSACRCEASTWAHTAVAGLDRIKSGQVVNLFRELNARQSVLYITHDPATPHFASDHVAIMPRKTTERMPLSITEALDVAAVRASPRCCQPRLTSSPARVPRRGGKKLRQCTVAVL